MKKAFTVILVFGAVVFGSLLISTSQSPVTRREKNVKYMRDRLGGIVLEYVEKQGNIPDTFEIALKDSGDTLPNRGDYFGGALIYEKLSDTSFRFVAFGKNGQYDYGKADDVVVTYVNGIWTTSHSL